MTIVRTLYPSGAAFDASYYFTKHLPMAARVMGAYGIRNVEMMRVSGTADGAPPRYQLIVSLYFESAAAAQSAIQSAEWRQVVADIPNYFGGTPEVFIGEIVAVASDDAEQRRKP